jgi:hypothetical protein
MEHNPEIPGLAGEISDDRTVVVAFIVAVLGFGDLDVRRHHLSVDFSTLVNRGRTTASPEAGTTRNATDGFATPEVTSQVFV